MCTGFLQEKNLMLLVILKKYMQKGLETILSGLWYFFDNANSEVTLIELYDNLIFF